MRKIILIFAIFISAIILFQKTENVYAISCQDYSSVPLGGNYTVATSCTFEYNVDGVDNGDLIVQEGVTLTINSGQTVVFNPGHKIVINGQIAINKGSPGGQIKKTYIWAKDFDRDTYYSSFVAQDTNPGGASKRRSELASWPSLDDIDDSNDCIDTVIHECCDDTNPTDGNRPPKSAQCLSVCKRCNGSSIDVEYAPTDGKVCSGGSWTSPSASAYCSYTNSCTAGACVGTRYYNGCAAGSTSCTSVNRTSVTIYAAEGYTLTSSCGRYGTTLCGYSSWICDGSCKRKRDMLRCDASHNCAKDVGDQFDYVDAGKICSNGNEVSGICGYSSWTCVDDCQRKRDKLACNGSGSCTQDVGDEIVNCNPGYYCSNGSCISGCCKVCYDCDGSGSCVAKSCAIPGLYCCASPNCCFNPGRCGSIGCIK